MSNMQNKDGMEKYLNRIEKSAKFWRGVAVSLMALIGVGVMTGQASQQAMSRNLLEKLALQPQVVGISQIVGSSNNTPFVALVRVWSDGTTEMMGQGPETARLFAFGGTDSDGINHAYAFDVESQQWWPKGTLSGTNDPVYSSNLYWRPFVDEDLSRP